jgi:hypothetical protein
MDEPTEDLRRAVRELTRELARAAEQAGRMARQVAKDLGGWAGIGPVPPPPPQGPSPVEAIRQLAELRDAGLITDEEFQMKKTELLARI